jgi:hypothetical protein
VDSATLRTTRRSLALVKVLEGLLFALAMATAVYGALDFSQTGSLFSLWVAVLLLLMTFAPLIRNRLLGMAVKEGDQALVYALQVLLFTLAAVTAAYSGWHFKTTDAPQSLWVLILIGLMCFWPHLRYRLTYGDWKRG